MNGVHDLGGMHGMGPVDPEPREPVFHEAWERRAFALTLAAGFLGEWNLDMSRHAREQMPPAEYLSTSYYEHWLYGLERLLVDQGLVTREELQGRLAGGREPVKPAAPGLRVLRAEQVGKVLLKGGTARREAGLPPRFRVGDRVVTRNIHPPGHTRLPRYARGRRGAVDRDHGVFVFADSHCTGDGRPQHLYSVRFEAPELWGPQGGDRDAVYIDLWDEHLDPA